MREVKLGFKNHVPFGKVLIDLICLSVANNKGTKNKSNNNASNP
jgi:hypothetical protein